MVDHAYRERVTLLLVNDALEANNRDRAEAIFQLIDAAGTLIVQAKREDGDDAQALASVFAQYLIDQVTAITGGGE